jgi:hypothetical protein
VQEQDHRIALNPGSVGAPINGDPRAQYGLLTWQGDRWQAGLRAVAYDVAQARAAYHQSGVLEAGGAMTCAFLRCVETGQNVPGRFVLHVRQLAAADGYANPGDAPDALWDEAVATFDWERAAQKRNAAIPDHATEE